MFTIISGQLLLITMVGSDLRQAVYSNTGLCCSDAPATIKTVSRLRCSNECLNLAPCRDFNYNSSNNECTLFRHKPLFTESKPGCAEFKARLLVIRLMTTTNDVEAMHCRAAFTTRSLGLYKRALTIEIGYCLCISPFVIPKRAI